jgi:hypothetical protein
MFSLPRYFLLKANYTFNQNTFSTNREIILFLACILRIVLYKLNFADIINQFEHHLNAYEMENVTQERFELVTLFELTSS